MQIKLMGFYRDTRRNLRLLTRLDAPTAGRSSLGRADFPFYFSSASTLSRTQLIKGLFFHCAFRRPRVVRRQWPGKHDGRHHQHNRAVSGQRSHPPGRRMKTTRCWTRGVRNFISARKFWGVIVAWREGVRVYRETPPTIFSFLPRITGEMSQKEFLN